MTDTVREPRQPRRLEKKRNTWVGSLGIAVTHGMDGAGPDDLPAQREYRVTLTYYRPPAGHVIVDEAQEL